MYNVGYIPSEINTLGALSYLDLSNNAITGMLLV